MTSKVDAATKLRRYLNKNGDIENVIVQFSHHGVSARAMPNSFHPIVAQRRSMAFAERGGETISIADATEINNASLRVPVARGHGATFEDAVDALMGDTKKLVSA
jgi:hypothetical protein